MTINTHRGLFRYNRMPFGVSSAPSVFQRIMDSLLQNIPGVIVYLDDILITSKTKEKHLKNLEETLCRLAHVGLKLKRRKCQFLQSSVQCLGYQIDAKSLHPTEDKVRAIKAAPKPTNVAELKSYLGSINYYGRFLPNLASQMKPLYDLLAQGNPWKWGQGREKAFTKSKEWLHSVLVHYDPTKELILCCDASPYGSGAVLCHPTPDGADQPVGFASRTLSKAEQGYSQLEKEGLSVIFGVKKFNQYHQGAPSSSILTTSHAVLGLLGENKGIPTARIQRWGGFLIRVPVYHKTSERLIKWKC